jgi:hypothetical protein
MHNQPYPYYMRNMNQWQIPPCMRGDQPSAVSPSQMPMQPPVVSQSQMQMQMQPEADMPEYLLEDMYPRSYDIIYPEVVRQCDMFDKDSLGIDIPTREDINRMTDNITAAIEPQVEADMNSENGEGEMRQFGFAGRRLLRDLVGVLLLRELFQRRHRPHRPRRRFPYYGW